MYGGFWGLLMLISAVWVIYDVFTHQSKKSAEWKILVTALAIVGNILTAIIYYFVVKKK